MFPLNPEQDELRKSAAQFGRAKLAAGYAEREARAEFSRADWDRLADRGFTGMISQPPLSIAARLEGLGHGCADNGLLMSLNAHLWGCVLPVHSFASESLRASLLPALSSGRQIGAIAATEEGAGSDFAALECRAEQNGTDYVLTGRKSYVTNAPVADVFVVYARTSTEPGIRSTSAFVVRKGESGVSISAPYAKSGLKTAPLAELKLDGCRVPKERLLGKVGDGSVVFALSMRWERALILASVVGATERILETCVAYSKERKAGNKVLGDFAGVRRRLADIKTRHETSRLLIYRAAHALETQPDSMLLSSLVKRSVSEDYVKTCQDAMAIFAAQGLLVERGLERELRDAMASVVYSGTSDIQEEIIARLL